MPTPHFFRPAIQVLVPITDRCEIFAGYWLWSEVSQDLYFGKIDIAITTINNIYLLFGNSWSISCKRIFSFSINVVFSLKNVKSGINGKNILIYSVLRTFDVWFPPSFTRPSTKRIHKILAAARTGVQAFKLVWQNRSRKKS